MRGGEVIKQARGAAGLTQVDLADKVGTTQSAIARWERGATEPSFSKVLEILEVCGVTFELGGLESAKKRPRSNTAATSRPASSNPKDSSDQQRQTGQSQRAPGPAIPGLEVVSDVLNRLGRFGRR